MFHWVCRKYDPGLPDPPCWAQHTGGTSQGPPETVPGDSRCVEPGPILHSHSGSGVEACGHLVRFPATIPSTPRPTPVPPPPPGSALVGISAVSVLPDTASRVQLGFPGVCSGRPGRAPWPGRGRHLLNGLLLPASVFHFFASGFCSASK